MAVVAKMLKVGKARPRSIIASPTAGLQRGVVTHDRGLDFVALAHMRRHPGSRDRELVPVSAANVEQLLCIGGCNSDSARCAHEELIVRRRTKIRGRAVRPDKSPVVQGLGALAGRETVSTACGVKRAAGDSRRERAGEIVAAAAY